MKIKKYTNNSIFTLYSDDNISKDIINGNLWEPHLLKFMSAFVKSGDCCLDIGACFGWHTLHLSYIVGDSGIVYAFEPIKDNLELLEENIKENRIKNVIVHNNALGNKNIKTCIYHETSDENKNLGDAFISPDFNTESDSDLYIDKYIYKCGQQLKLRKEIINCNRLDSFKFDKPIDFIKLDVQGFEKMVIEGGEELIKKDRPVIAIELEDPCMILYGYSSKELISYIQSLGYYIYFLDFTYPCDHICVPIEKLKDFEKLFEGKIHPHLENNPINNNFDNGIVTKISL